MREIARAYDTDERYVARVTALAFLPTQLTQQILAGTQPPDLTLSELLSSTQDSTIRDGCVTGQRG